MSKNLVETALKNGMLTEEDLQKFCLEQLGRNDSKLNGNSKLVQTFVKNKVFSCQDVLDFCLSNHFDKNELEIWF